MSSGRRRRELPGAHARPLPPEEEARWKEVQEKFRTVREKMAAAIRVSAEDLRFPELDQRLVLDALHVPDDAGEYGAALEQILRRIPDRWGRFIDCEKGWYPLVVELDRELSALDPDYTMLQMKQKWGQLVCYFETRSDHDAEMDGLVLDTWERSSRICERCGAPGGPAADRLGKVQTLCARCQAEQGGG